MELYDGVVDGVVKVVRLRFLRTELLYDISNYAFVEGDVMGDDAEHARHQVRDIAEEGNVDRVNRVLKLAYDECVEQLYPYTDDEVADGEVVGDELFSPSDYVIELRVAKGMRQSTLRLLGTLVHEYMVCRVLGDWLGLTYPDSAGVWEMKVERLRSKMRTCLLSRNMCIHRKMKPF